MNSFSKHVLLENMVKVANVCNSYADDLTVKVAEKRKPRPFHFQ